MQYTNEIIQKMICDTNLQETFHSLNEISKLEDEQQ